MSQGNSKYGCFAKKRRRSRLGNPSRSCQMWTATMGPPNVTRSLLAQNDPDAHPRLSAVSLMQFHMVGLCTSWNCGSLFQWPSCLLDPAQLFFDTVLTSRLNHFPSDFKTKSGSSISSNQLSSQKESTECGPQRELNYGTQVPWRTVSLVSPCPHYTK